MKQKSNHRHPPIPRRASKPAKAPDHSEKITGTFFSSGHGYGFVRPFEKTSSRCQDDIFIPAKETACALHMDTVIIRVRKDKRRGDPLTERYEGYDLKITGHGLTEFCGELSVLSDLEGNPAAARIIPDDQHLPVGVFDELPEGVRDGDKVNAKICCYPRFPGDDLLCKITEVYGKCEDRSANYRAILKTLNVRTEFPQDVISAANDSAQKDINCEERRDLRGELIFTVDSEEAKDLDDAICVKRTQDGYLLGVHIADVSSYVSEDSPIEREAYLRGTSIYFIDKVIPMLPPSLSNGSCSLDAGVDRYTLSAWITLDRNGEILDTNIEESVIRSRIRGVYRELNDLTECGESSSFYEKYKQLFPQTFYDVLNLYEILKNRREKNGALDFETDEPHFLIGPDGDPVGVERTERGVWERVIEQFMLVANEAIASFAEKKDLPILYRVHDDPSPEKTKELILLASSLGLDVSDIRPEKPDPAAFRRLSVKAAAAGKEDAFSMPLLRTLSKAVYSDTLRPHFGLAMAKYCHFTSPIRRYPDLFVHRVIKEYLHLNNSGTVRDRYRTAAEKAAGSCTACELAAVNAERQIEDLYRVLLMRDRVGEICSAVITSVCSFGFYAKLENTCEGLVSVSMLPGEYVYDEKRYCLYSSNAKFSPGDRVTVMIDRVDVSRRKIDFLLTDENGTVISGVPKRQKERNHPKREKHAAKPRRSDHPKKGTGASAKKKIKKKKR